ncbi:MAG TPA: lipopolysaccharide heptosyltransferase I [Methylomirabilota bacterium]
MNILIVKLSSLGDVVHALPVAATLRARQPGARIAWAVERREAAVLAGHPAIDEIIVADTRDWRGLGRLATAARGMRRLASRLAGARFDVVIDLQGLLKSGVLVALTRAPQRVGFAARDLREPLSALFTNRRVARPAGRHVVEQYLALLEPLAVGPPVLEFRLPSDPAAEAGADAFFAGAGLKPRDRVVVLNPGAGRPDKRWPTDRFATLARRLGDESVARAVVVWGPGEEAAARAITEGAGGRAAMAPPTDLLQLIALLRRASVVVAGDTGPLHLAAALGRPCVGIYGPTAAWRNGPYGAGHRTLQGAGDQITWVEVEPVFRAVVELLS